MTSEFLSEQRSIELHRSWTYNVQDRFKSCTQEEIKKELRATAFPVAVCMEHFSGDFNVSTVIRNANGFNAREVFYLSSRKKIDRRGAVGTYHYTPVTWLNDISQLIELKKDYTLIGIDNVPGSVSMESFQWPTPVLMVFGEEGLGLTQETMKICDAIVHIPMFGSVRSFNAGTASGIALYDFIAKNKR